MLERVCGEGNHPTLGGNVNWYSHYGEQYGGVFKKLKIELPYQSVISLLGIYLENNLI